MMSLNRGTSSLMKRPPLPLLEKDLVFPQNVWEAVAEIKEQWAHREFLEEHGLVPSHKLLLFGPPGCGKTSLAHHLAHTLGRPFFEVCYHDLISSYLGETGSKLFKIFEEAEKEECILFFDEFDSIGKSRGDSRDVGEMGRIVNQLLIYLDRVLPSVFLIAASNRMDVLDHALARRFDVVLEIPSPERSDLVSAVEKLGVESGLPDTIVNYAEAISWVNSQKRKHILAMHERG